MNSPTIQELKAEIKATIRSNSDRGFLHYSECNNVCHYLSLVLDQAEQHHDARYVMEVFMLVIVETLKLRLHADDSDGMTTDNLNHAIATIERLCEQAEPENRDYFFKFIMKTVKNKVFKDWAEEGFSLLRAAVPLVQTDKEAGRIYDMFPLLGTMYSGSEYPDQHVVTHSLILKLEGEEAANRYINDHLEVDELRAMAVEQALEVKRYEEAERLCLDALKSFWGNGIPEWALYLDRIYAETSDIKKQIGIVKEILLHDHISFYIKLKLLYENSGQWNEELKVELFHEMSKHMQVTSYGLILQEEQEWELLLEQVQSKSYLIEIFGKTLVKVFPQETAAIYEKVILHDAEGAGDRRKYRGICKQLNEYAKVVDASSALHLLDQLAAKYPRRPAMLEELEKVKTKLNKPKKTSK